MRDLEVAKRSEWSLRGSLSQTSQGVYQPVSDQKGDNRRILSVLIVWCQRQGYPATLSGSYVLISSEKNASLIANGRGPDRCEESLPACPLVAYTPNR
jgi:hypothetical protein